MQGAGRPPDLVAVQPAVVVDRAQDGGHAVMVGTHDGVGLDGDDGHRLQLGAVLSLPSVPHASQSEELVVGEREAEWDALIGAPGRCRYCYGFQFSPHPLGVWLVCKRCFLWSRPDELLPLVVPGDRDQAAEEVPHD